MIQDLGRIADSLNETETAEAATQPKKVLESLDRALELAQEIRDSRNEALRDDSHLVSELVPTDGRANGRTYLDEVDDVKDHQPGRTVDMTYLVYRELQYPLVDWLRNVVATRTSTLRPTNSLYAFEFDWKNTSTN